MPVHEIKYRAYEGPLYPHVGRLFAITRYSLMAIGTRLLTLTLFGIGSIQLVAYVGYLLVMNNEIIRTALQLTSLPQLTPQRILMQFLVGQTFIAVAVLLQSAPKMIAPERQHKALPMLYSRPISRGGYIFGKFFGLFLLLAYLTIVQTFAIALSMLAFYPPEHQIHAEFASFALPLFVRSLIAGTVISAGLSVVSLTASAMTTNTRYAAILMLMIFFAGSGISGFLREKVSEALGSLGIGDLLVEFIGHMIRPEGEHNLGLTATVIALFVWTGICLLITRSKLRPVEVYRD